MQRRKFLQNSSLTLGALSLGFTATAKEKKKPLFKIGFLSDVHVKATTTAEEGMSKAFRKANSIKPKLDFIINGGDAIMDAMKATKEKVQQQWDVWNKVLTAENKLPIYHCIGNHDAWGWQMTEPEIKNDVLYDKKWAIQQHKMPNRYYSFDFKNWKFIILDSAQENNGGYIAKLDDEQFAWLENELKNTDTKTPICIASHIPIVSFCSAMFSDKNEANGDWKISRALLHTDNRKMIQLFKKYANIKCCLSGHIHMQDEVEYLGIKYFCNGAVSGNWWSGAFKDFAPAFAVFTFYESGEVSREIVDYSLA